MSSFANIESIMPSQSTSGWEVREMSQTTGYLNTDIDGMRLTMCNREIGQL